MTSPAGIPEDPARLRRRLRYLRWLRRTALFGLFFPVLLTLAIVLIGKLTGGGMRFLVSGAPWTHYFWSGLFYVLVAGGAAAILAMVWPCPGCGNNFFRRMDYNPRYPPAQLGYTGTRTNINFFGGSCLNCGLRMDGANAGEKLMSAKFSEAASPGGSRLS